MAVSNVAHLSLLSGPVPISLTMGAFLTLAWLLIGVGPRGWRRVTVSAVASLAGVVAIGTVFGIEHRVGSTFPQSFFIWAALPVFAATLAVSTWRRWQWRRRLGAALAVVLLLAFGADCVNAHYAYLPTVGDAIGRPVEDQLPTAQVLPAATRGHLMARRQPASAAGARHGVVLSVDIPGEISHFRARDAMVWLPPAYFATPSPQLPVIVLLAGVPGDPVDLLRAAHVARIADLYAAAHQGIAPILVFPDHNGGFFNDSECVDGPRGNVETYFTVDVPAFLAAQFHAAVLGRDLGIGGYSEGGTCAATIALRHPDRVNAFLDISGDMRPNAASGPSERPLTIRRLYGGDVRQWQAHDPVSLLQRPMPTQPAALFAAGTDDAHALTAARTLAAAAEHAGLPVVLRTYPGGHSFALAHRALTDLLPALADQVLHPASPSKLA